MAWLGPGESLKMDRLVGWSEISRLTIDGSLGAGRATVDGPVVAGRLTVNMLWVEK